jgi:hypothetical protein
MDPNPVVPVGRDPIGRGPSLIHSRCCWNNRCHWNGRWVLYFLLLLVLTITYIILTNMVIVAICDRTNQLAAFLFLTFLYFMMFWYLRFPNGCVADWCDTWLPEPLPCRDQVVHCGRI